MAYFKKESDAWRYIAERIAADRWRGFGLCAEVTACHYTHHEISLRLYDRMNRRIAEHLGRRTYGWPMLQAAPRVLAALFLALEAEEEEHATNHT